MIILCCLYIYLMRISFYKKNSLIMLNYSFFLFVYVTVRIAAYEQKVAHIMTF